MKRHFIKKYIFTILFLCCLFVFSAKNFIYAAPKLLAAVKESDWSLPKEAVASLEDAVNENVYQKYAFLEGYGLMQNVLGSDVENGFSYVRAKDGALFYAAGQDEDENLDQNIQDIVRIRDIAEDAGAEMFVFLAPDMYLEGQKEFRSGIPYEDRNGLLDRTAKAMKEEKIPCIDTRDYLQDITEWTGEDLFYRTDHHWRTKAAFYMFGVLTDRMADWYGEDLDPDGLYTNLDHYNVYRYEDFFLGSMGRETGILYGGLDDFDVIFPKFETDFVRTYRATGESEPQTAKGPFLSSLMRTYNMNDVEEPYETDRYASYLEAVNMEDSIVNQRNTNGPKVLLIRDSFMAPLAAFMASTVSRLDLVWHMRYTDDLEMKIRQGGYDYVIVETGAVNLNNADLFPGLRGGVGSEE